MRRPHIRDLFFYGIILLIMAVTVVALLLSAFLNGLGIFLVFALLCAAVVCAL